MGKAAKAPGVKKSLYNIDPLIKRKMKYITAMDETLGDQTRIVNKAIGEFIERWEKKHGPIPIR
jgi:hypothetical protein